jgi:hypothetical protein
MAMRSVEIERAILRRRIAIEACRVAVRPSDKMHTVIKPESDGGTNGDRELLQRDQRALDMLTMLVSVRSIIRLTSQMGRRDLRLIQWNDHTEHSYSNTTDDSAGEEVRRTLRSCLETSTDCEDDDSREHGVLA